MFSASSYDSSMDGCFKSLEKSFQVSLFHMVNSKPANKPKKKKKIALKISFRDVVITEDTYVRYNSLYLSDFIPSKEANTILMSTLI